MPTSHTVSHVTLLVSSGKFMSGSAFFLSPPENKKAKFAFCTLKRKGGSTQKQPFLTVRFRGALLTKSVTLEFSQDTVCRVDSNYDTTMMVNKHLHLSIQNNTTRTHRSLCRARPHECVEKWRFGWLTKPMVGLRGNVDH